jgi:hypothetical protein
LHGLLSVNIFKKLGPLSIKVVFAAKLQLSGDE